MAFGVVGPSDCVLICGYDGDVLLGWSTFQDIPDDHDIPHDILGYFRKPNWHENTRGYLILGKQFDSTQHRRIYRDALELAYRVIVTSVLGDRIVSVNFCPSLICRAGFLPYSTAAAFPVSLQCQLPAFQLTVYT